METCEDDGKVEQTEYGYRITCGDSRAVLLLKKFVCPGINVRCVQFDDQLISPKQFVHLAGKATLKDWKRAIRVGGVMLRANSGGAESAVHLHLKATDHSFQDREVRTLAREKGWLERGEKEAIFVKKEKPSFRRMMDSGEIDFYRHNHMCSNTCRSTKFNVRTNGPRPSMGTPMQPGSSCVAPQPSGGQVPPMTELLSPHDAAEGRLENESRATAGWSSGLPRLVHFTASSWHSLKRKRADTPDGVLRLWRGVADSGLMGEVLSSVQSELLTALQRVELCREKADLQEADTFMLNSLCEMFGLLESVKQTVDIRCRQSEESKIHHRVYALNDILGEGSKLSCRSYTNSSSKQYQSRKNRRTQRDTAKTKTGICSLSDVDLGSASHNGIFPQSSSFTDPRVGASKACGDGQGSLREHEVSRAGKQETAQRQEDTVVNGQRSDKLLGLCQLKREDVGDKESPSKSREEEKHNNMAKM